MKITALLSRLTGAVVVFFFCTATGAFASTVVLDYELENCSQPPEHEELSKLADEFQTSKELSDYLIQKYGCTLAVDEEYLAQIQEKYKHQQIITNTGSIRYEALESCGYHPQREEFACSISVRQRFGFAGYPAIGAGSNEWVLICLDYGNGLMPMDTASVHVHDEPHGKSPYWYYAAIVQADETLQKQVQKGQTLRARAILSWAAQPTDCSYQPVWGNQADFRIKLDP